MRLLEKITQALIEYLRMQAKCGVDALQIFDSWHNLCPPEKLWEYSLQWIAEMIKNVPKGLSIIVYANSSTSGISQILRTGTKAVGVHHRAELSAIRKQFPSPLVLQGNLSPEIMETNEKNVIRETTLILDSMRNDPAHIMNLGHGIRPGAKIECMDALVSTVRSYQS
jgi:uroporphyrinogen decarboxylase